MNLETDRLTLCPVARADIDAWADFLGDPDAVRLVHFPEPHDRESAERLLTRTIERAEGAKAMYAVVLRETGETVGFVGYSPREMEWGPELELGWLLLPRFHGRGYATEAARRVRSLVPERVISLIRQENVASINVARNLHAARPRHRVRRVPHARLRERFAGVGRNSNRRSRPAVGVNPEHPRTGGCAR